MTIVKTEAVPAELALIKFGVPVRFVSKDEAASLPAIAFEKIAVAGETAQVTFVYDVEGVVGDVRLRRDASAGWAVESFRLPER